MIKVIFSEKSKKQIKDELNRYPFVETGGVLLGYKREGIIFIEESVDGGINAKRDKAFFRYDYEYVDRVCGSICDNSSILFVIGLWHKHNHDLEPAFSVADYDIHRRLLEMCEFGISCIFQKKINMDYQVHILDSNMENIIIPNMEAL